MRSNILCTVCALFLVVCSQVGIAQQTELIFSENTPASPEASALKDFIDIPVNGYTGVPGISIPLMSIGEKGITVPIGISYHAAGRKVTEEASSVGLGWALNAGGVITREIKDKDDFGGETVQGPFEGFAENYGNRFAPPQGTEYEYFDNNLGAYKYCAADDNNGISPCPAIPTNNGGSIDPYDTFCPLYQFDLEPDLFTFNFLGQGGKFVMNGNGDYVSLNNPNLTIIYDQNTNGFVLTDNTGMSYFFGSTVSSQEKTYTQSFASVYNNFTQFLECGDGVNFESETVMSWYLDKITSANGGEIELIYSNSVKAVQLIPSYAETVKALNPYGWSDCNNGFGPDVVECLIPGPAGAPFTKYISKIRQDNVLLQKIKNNYGESARFIYGPRLDIIGDERLNSIQYEVGGQAQYEQSFSYGYFQGDLVRQQDWHNNVNSSCTYLLNDINLNDDNLLKRLKLNSVQHKAINTGDSKPPYVFIYNESKKLPSKTSLDYDFWGFYNDADNDQIAPSYLYDNEFLGDFPGPIPSTFGCVGNDKYPYYISNRRPNEDYYQTWILDTLTDPLGGKKAITYEIAQFDSNELDEYGLTDITRDTSDESSENLLWQFRGPGQGSSQTRLRDTIFIDDGACFGYSAGWHVEHACPNSDNCRCTSIYPDLNQAHFRASIYPITDILNSVWSSFLPQWSNTATNDGPVDTTVWKLDYEATAFSDDTRDMNGNVYPCYNNSNVYLPAGIYVIELENGECTDYPPDENVKNLYFQLHWQNEDFDYTATTIRKGGSLRATSITSWLNGGTVRTEFSYGEGNNGLGKLMSTPDYTTPLFTIVPDSDCESSSNPFGIQIYTSFNISSSSTVPMVNRMGTAPVAHKQMVKKIFMNGEYQGFTESHYHLIPVEKIPRLPWDGYESYYDPLNGTRIKEFVFGANGPISETETSFTKRTDLFDKVWASFIDPIEKSTGRISSNCPSPSLNLEPYNIVHYAYEPSWVYQASTTTKSFGTVGSGHTTSGNSLIYRDDNFSISQYTTYGPGVSYTYDYRYASDLNNSLLISNDMSGVPLEILLNNGTDGGTKVDYAEYSGNILPTKYYRWKSPDQVSGSALWEWTHDIKQYTGDGFPLEVDYRGFNLNRNFTWTGGLLTTMSIGSRIKEWDYHPNRRLEKYTAIDLQETDYQYDGLLRLKEVSKRGGKVKNSYTYNYALFGSDNSIYTETDISDTDYAFDAKQVFNEVGQVTENRKIAYAQSGADFSSGIVLDPMGRTLATCDQGQGACLNRVYEDAPNARVLREYWSGWPTDKTFEYKVVNGQMETHATEAFSQNDDRTVITTLDGDGRTVKVERPDGAIISYAYDGRGNLLSVSGPAGDYTYSYDGLGRLSYKIVPDGGRYDYTYYENDLLHTSTDPNGTILFYEYTEFGEVENVRQGEGGPILKGYTYYNSGEGKTGKIRRLEAATSNGQGLGIYDYFYDDYGRIETTFSRGPGGGGTYKVLEIDNADFPLLTSTSGITMKNAYDHGGRLTGVEMGYDEQELNFVGSYEYNDNDWKVKHNLGGNPENPLQTMDYSYNSRGWLQKINDIDSRKTFIEETYNYLDDIPDENDIFTTTTDVVAQYSSEEIWNCIPTSIRLNILIKNKNVATDKEYISEKTEYILLNGATEGKEQYNSSKSYSFSGHLDGQILGNLIENDVEGDFPNGETMPSCLNVFEDCEYWAKARLNGDFGDYVVNMVNFGSSNILSYGSVFHIDDPADRTALANEINSWLSSNGGGTASVFWDAGVFSIRLENVSEINNYNYFILKNEVNGVTTKSHFASSPTSGTDCQLVCDYTSNSYTPKGCELGGHEVVFSVSIGDQNIIPFGTLYDMLDIDDRANLKILIETWLTNNNYTFNSVFISRYLIKVYGTDAPFDGIFYVCPTPGDSQSKIVPFRRACYDNADCEEVLCSIFGTIIPDEIDDIDIDDIAPFPDDFPVSYDCDLFAEDIFYHDLKDPVNATQYFTGNISYTNALVGDSKKLETYVYDYDLIDQLTSTTHWQEHLVNAQQGLWQWTNTNIYNTSYGYDAAGNITTLQRSGLNKRLPNNTLEFGAMDNLTFTYGSIPNQVQSILENDQTDKFIDHGFKTVGGDIQYDSNGNITKYGPDQIDEIQYDIFNYPKLIKYDDGRTVELVYDTEGFKHKMEFKNSSGVTEKKYTYGGSRITSVDVVNNTVEEYHPFDGGRYIYDEPDNEWSLEYSLRDHLGNGRVWIKDLNGDEQCNCIPYLAYGDSEITQVEHYYPFGMSWDGAWKSPGSPSDQISNPMKYNEKQSYNEDGLDWMDYGARWYDPSIGRFTTRDPIDEAYAAWTPYHYVHNSPVKFIDPYGLSALYPGMEYSNPLTEYLDDASENSNSSKRKKKKKKNNNASPTDTLVIHRGMLNLYRSDDATNVWNVSFSIISDGEESPVLDENGDPLVMYMISNSSSDKKGDNYMNKEVYPLTFQTRNKKLDDNGNPRKGYENEILVVGSPGRKQFFHPGNSYLHFDGCKGFCFNMDLAGERRVFVATTMKDSRAAHAAVRDVYEKIKPYLTGDKMILKTNSYAPRNPKQ